jgi:hypothetical protein
MKIVAIGDTHGRTEWKEIIARESDADKVIFIGDYLDSYDIGVKKQVKNFKEILDYKESSPDKVILLIGNHDYHYLPAVTGRQEKYSGWRYPFYRDCSGRLDSGTRTGKVLGCYVIGDIIFSHAGISKTWCRIHNVDLDNLQESVNTLLVKDDGYSFSFEQLNKETMSFSNPYGNNLYQSPIWIRPSSLIKDKLEGYKQVVGHTQVTQMSEVEGVYLIDCLDNEKKEYLVIEDGEFIFKTL